MLLKVAHTKVPKWRRIPDEAIYDPEIQLEAALIYVIATELLRLAKKGAKTGERSYPQHAKQALDKLHVFRILNGLGSSFGVELYEEIGNVGFNRTLRQKQFITYFFVGKSERDFL